jgi:HPr Serine kinase C-terminal domain
MPAAVFGPTATPASANGGTRATVFGLHVQSDRRIAMLEGVQGRSGERVLELRMHRDVEEKQARWGAGSVICSRREANRPEMFRIEAYPGAGYLVWSRACGSYLLSLSGQRLDCAHGDCPPARWERFLIGQVLPFAALVSGLEIFHASCVALNGEAIAFLGSSGAGKTSIALSLCDRGARFVADDVLALEARGTELVAHPGTPLAGIDRSEARRLRAAGRLMPGEVLMSDRREQMVRVGRVADAANLHALFFLDRRPHGPADPAFEPVTDPKTLLAATFNFVLTSPERLRGLLNVCALAAQRRVERIVAGPSVDASELGVAVKRRLSDAT